MREYFCAYHSMLEATRKLSDAEVGRLFRGLLYYSITGEQPDNLQGREDLLFDVFSQNIDREVDKYNERCRINRTNRHESSRIVTSRHESSQEEDKEKDEDKNKDKEKDIPSAGAEGGGKRKRFHAPTVEEVAAYALEKGYSPQEFSPERFVDYYTSKGWKVGTSPMKDWKSAARGWVSRQRTEQPQRAEPANNPALDYQQRQYSAEDDESFYTDLDALLGGIADV